MNIGKIQNIEITNTEKITYFELEEFIFSSTCYGLGMSPQSTCVENLTPKLMY
jgi:hypothetical protein